MFTVIDILLELTEKFIDHLSIALLVIQKIKIKNVCPPVCLPISLFVCLFVCLFVHLFLGFYETDWDTLWSKVAFCSWEGSKAKILLIEA